MRSSTSAPGRRRRRSSGSVHRRAAARTTSIPPSWPTPPTTRSSCTGARAPAANSPSAYGRDRSHWRPIRSTRYACRRYCRPGVSRRADRDESGGPRSTLRRRALDPGRRDRVGRVASTSRRPPGGARGWELLGAAALLTVTKQEGGTGTQVAASAPAGVSCPIGCTEFCDAGTSGVTLTATPAPGSFFTGWGGSAAVDSARPAIVSWTARRAPAQALACSPSSSSARRRYSTTEPTSVTTNATTR
mgnify:CR=1 FL=1